LRTLRYRAQFRRLLRESPMHGLSLGFAAAALATLLASSPLCAQAILSASGATPADIQSSVDAFRADLGPLNPNVIGSSGSGRREINWDGVPDSLAAPNAFPPAFFNTTSPRGVMLGTPGFGFQVSASAASATPVEFGNINPSYSDLFTTFSPQRLFTPISSNITDVTFVVPGTSTPALSRGFGAVFTDVDLPAATTLQLFGPGGVDFGIYPVLPATGNETLSFLGIDFPSAVISRVRVTAGNTALGPNETASVDLVVMDDFIYGEPRAAVAVPGPVAGAGGSALLGLAGVWFVRRRKQRLAAQVSAWRRG
jgi:hypothetical protein